MARATASKVAAALDSGQRSPLGFHRTAPAVVVEKFLEYTERVQGLAIRTRERYRAALGHFVTFAGEAGVANAGTLCGSCMDGQKLHWRHSLSTG